MPKTSEVEVKVVIADKLRWRKDFGHITIYNFVTDELFKASSDLSVLLEMAKDSISRRELESEFSANCLGKHTADEVHAIVGTLIDKGILIEIN